MNGRNPCHCVFPSPTEETLATYEGHTSGTAIRVLVESGVDGYVRLQQMAFTETMGWYVQKSMVIPGELLGAITTQLRKADCLITKTTRPVDQTSLRLVTPADDDVAETVELRRA